MRATVLTFFKRNVNAFQDQRGIMLIEAVMAVAILGIALIPILSALSTTTRASQKVVMRFEVENMASSQMEYTKAQPFVTAPTTYETFGTIPTAYTVVTEAVVLDGYDGNIQKIVVTVSYEGRIVRVLEDIKVNR